MQPQPNQGLTLRGGFNLLYLLANAHATCLTVFTRHSFGVEALGFNGVAALILMVVYLCITNSRAVEQFLIVWLCLLLLQRIRTFWIIRRGRALHSRYEGYLWLGFAVPFVRRIAAAKVWEAFFCLVVGAGLSEVDLALSQFVTAGFISLGFRAAVDGEIDRKRLQRLRDAQIEMQYLVEQANRKNL